MSTIKKMLSVLVLAIVLIGCEKETIIVNPHDHDTENSTDISISLTSSLRGPVNRGSIPVWVKDITVDLEHQQTFEASQTVFDLVDDGSGDDSFVIPNVPLGINTLAATTTSDSETIFSLTKETDLSDEVAVLETYKSNNPYAVYSSPLMEVDVINELSVSVPMTTPNGRHITLFKLHEDIQDNYNFRITSSYVDDSGDVISDSKNVGNGSHGVVLYWSNEDATSGRVVTHEVSLQYQGQGGDIADYEITQTIVASTSTRTIHTIGIDNVYTDQIGLDFVFEEWTEN